MDLDSIQQRARSDLLLPSGDGGVDVFLWEHSIRVARNARLIARLPEAQALGADEFSVFVAALYHDAGWASRVCCGELDRLQVLLGPTSRSDCETGAIMLERSLRGAVSATVLHRSTVAVRSRLDRAERSADAIVLAEAEALDEFGVLPIWLAVRRGALEGRGVESAIESWVRKREYQFWTARLADSFCFAKVRELARSRLARIERFMAEVEIECLGQDLASIMGSAPRATAAADNRAG